MKRRLLSCFVANILAAIAATEIADWQEELRQASNAGDAGKILQALQAGASPNVVYSETRKIPTSAARLGSAAAGADTSYRTETFFETPLTLAVRSGRAAAVLTLLEHGAGPNLERICGGAALYLAVSSNSLELTEILLRSGARDLRGTPCITHRSNSNGDTSLLTAIRLGSEDIALRLLNSKSDPNAPNNAGETPLMLAASRNDAYTVHKLIANGARSFWRDSQGRFAYELTTNPVLAGVLREAFLKDGTDLARVPESAAIKDSLTLLLKLAAALPAGDREWNELCRRLGTAVQWLKNRPRWPSIPADYEHTLTLDIYALDEAARRRSKPLLAAIVVDLEIKRRDCTERGPGAAGDDVRFQVVTVAFPRTPSPGWIVRFRHALDFRTGEWDRFNDPTEAVQTLPPGPYRMYVERPDKMVKSCPEDVQVSFRQKRFTFVAPANTPPRCQ